MKKIGLRIAVALATFLIGTGIFVFVFFYFDSIPELPAPAIFGSKNVENKTGDVETASFPGLAEKISDLKKGENGYYPKSVRSGNFDWYAGQLRLMGEKSLLSATGETTEIYRFLWLRSFEHPIFVRLERTSKEIKLLTKEFDGSGSDEPGKVIRNSEIAVNEKDFRVFLSLLEKARFWTLTSEEQKMGRDGAEWILEGVREKRYHVVERWSPKTGEYREACIYLLKLSGFDTDRLKGELY